MIQSYPWYIADWRQSETVARMTLSQKGLYRELLDYCYLEGSIPDDRRLLLKIAGCNMEAEAEHCVSTGEALPEHSLRTARARLGHDLSTVLALFEHNVSTHRFHHSKVEEVRTKVLSYHEQKRHAGAKSGQARRERSLNGRSEVVRTDDEPSPAPTPTPDIEEPPKPPAPTALALSPPPANGHHRNGKNRDRTSEQIRKALGPEREKWWDAFWKVFPCHDGMKAGLDTFERKVHTRELAVEIFRGAERYAQQVAADPEMKLKYAQGWINGERWKDENKIQPESNPYEIEYPNL